MVVQSDLHHMVDREYSGHILHGHYSEELKARVVECCNHFHALESIGYPIIPYISAWRDGDKSIWYEFVSNDLLTLLHCAAEDIARVFKNKIIDVRMYDDRGMELGVMKKIISRHQLPKMRQSLREEAQKAGRIEAVYKIAVEKSQTLWLKDQATVEKYSHDQICLSLGYLTIVSKEMKAEEEQERQVVQLREDLGRIRKTIIQGRFL